MTRLFMPSCNNSLVYSRSLEKLMRYLISRGIVDSITGCCKPNRPNYVPVPKNAEIVCICNTCTAIAEESIPGSTVTNALLYILDDPTFKYPDYGGEQITVQDCWRARGRGELHEGIRELLRKMNLEPVELEENRDASRFCGLSTFEELPPIVSELAPCRFGHPGEGMFTQCSREEMLQQMREHAALITTPRVASYCFSCDQGLELGGADSVSVLNLLFDEIDSE